jgi:hypothetical protein
MALGPEATTSPLASSVEGSATPNASLFIEPLAILRLPHIESPFVSIVAMFAPHSSLLHGNTTLKQISSVVAWRSPL